MAASMKKSLKLLDTTGIVTYVMKILKNSTMISTSTSSWIRSRLWRDRIQLLVDVEIIVEFLKKFSWQR